jgi:putative tryptophan/tyrosine transport system substrate-binding protein
MPPHACTKGSFRGIRGPKAIDVKRLFLLFSISALSALTVGFAGAQQPKKVHRIGWIAFDGSRPPRDFMTGLRERGYIEGQSIIIEYRSAQGREERLPQIAAELVRLKPDVIVAGGNDATEAARKATRTIPIVFEHGDPLGNATVVTLAQPGNNLTGISSLSFELAGKRLELLRDAFPKISRVAVLLHADANHRRQFADMERVAKVLGVQLQGLEYKSVVTDLESVFRQAISQRANALLALPSPSVSRYRTRVLEFTAKNRLPAIYPYSEFAEAGGLMSYGPRDSYRRVAYYVDRILRGPKPSDLPVEQATRFELVINLKTAKQIGLTIAPKVLMWADRVISDDRTSEEHFAKTDLTNSQLPRMPRVGVLVQGSEGASFALEAIRRGLQELGYVEGRNLILEVQSTAGDDERRLPIAVAELLRRHVDVVVATNSRATRAVQQLTRTTPIVTTAMKDPSLLMNTLQSPTGNITGLSYVEPELARKRLELLRKTVPGLSRVTVLTTVADVSKLPALATSLGLKLQILNVTKSGDLENAFSLAVRGKSDALGVLDQTNLANRATIIDLAARSRLPAIYPRREYVETGGLMSYGPNHAELIRREAYYVDKILRGAKPADLAVERITKAELVINRSTAKSLGLAIPPEVLTAADKVIE